jgi:RHS repeat-associated protein
MIRSYTGFDYFGARYYASGLSVWVSVDPLADKYPSMSPYIYVAGNPIMRVDPDGRDHWEIGKNGNATLIDTKGRGIYVNGKKISKYNFTNNESAASTIITHYYDKNFSRNKYHLANGKVSIASFKNGSYDASSSYNMDGIYEPKKTSYASSLPGKGNLDGKNRITFYLEGGHVDKAYNNKYNLINALSHERTHLIQGATSSTIRNELQAYYVQMNHWSWKKTDGRYRSDMEGNAKDYIVDLRTWGYYRSGIKHDRKKYSQQLYKYYKKLFSSHIDTSNI